MTESVTSKNATTATPRPLDDLSEGGVAVASEAASLEQLFDVTLPVSIEFGRTTMTVQEILDLGAGSVVQLDRMVGEPIDIYVGDRRLAEGEVVVVGEHFGVRITRIISTARDGAARTAGHS
jgi:flagellar motor switch protein FliN/FliY